MEKEKVANRIYNLRKSKNLKQSELAKELGVSDKAISKWEQGTVLPTLEALCKISSFFGVSIDSLLADRAKVEPIKRVKGGMETIKELYKIGRGPSSSHTMGPERICKEFKENNPEADSFKVVLYGSLALTGIGHGTDRIVRETLAPIKTKVEFNRIKKSLPHPNTMEIFAYKGGEKINSVRAYSIGGGEVLKENEEAKLHERIYKLDSFEDISKYCKENDMRLSEYVEMVEGDGYRKFIQEVWDAMKEAIERGINTDGVLPGGLDVKRKAKYLFNQRHIDETPETRENRLVCAYAYAMGEENASGGKIVTAPTCGACGVVPAVLYYYQKKRGYSDNEIYKALAAAAVVGMLVKTNASISGAQCGCQAEIGTACSMAAAALGELFDMSIEQIEYAAEIALEHHLGLTCDPIGGLVQIPCIERNAVAAMRAINAVNIANFLTDTRKISLDLIIQTMYETGIDISEKYRETSTGGMAKLYKAFED